MIPESSVYKGWRVLVFNVTGCRWQATAILAGSRHLYADGQRGKGSKSRAWESIRKQIDECGGRSEGR